ncbi:MAG: hypothetical protein K2X01_06965 [Cyanobacteria bacterium]|nr:hypothetical protein [Cyanobacteriota bacterium]
MMSVSNTFPSLIPSQIAFSGKASGKSFKASENPSEDVPAPKPAKPSLWQRLFHHRATKVAAATVGVGGAAIAGGCAGNGYIYVDNDPYCRPRPPVVIYQDPRPVYCPPPVFIEPSCPPRYNHWNRQWCPPNVITVPPGGVYWQHHDQ